MEDEIFKKIRIKMSAFDIKALNLSCNKISSLKPNVFAGLAKLSFLDLSRCKIELIDDDSFNFLSNLEILSIFGNPIEINDFKNLAILPDNTNEKLNKLLEGYQKIIEIRKNELKKEDDKIKSTDDESKLEDVALTVKRILDMINTIQNDEIKLYLIKSKI